MSDTNTSAQPVVTQEKKSNTGKILIGCCLVIIVLMCLCCGALFLLFGATANSALAVYNQVQTSLVKVCDGQESDLRNFYDTRTTQEFKAQTSYSQFKSFYTNYKDIILDCQELKQGTFFNNKINGLQINMETVNGIQTLSVQYPSKSYTVSFQFVQQSNDWKINTIEIR